MKNFWCSVLSLFKSFICEKNFQTRLGTGNRASVRPPGVRRTRTKILGTRARLHGRTVPPTRVIHANSKTIRWCFFFVLAIKLNEPVMYK